MAAVSLGEKSTAVTASGMGRTFQNPFKVAFWSSFRTHSLVKDPVWGAQAKAKAKSIPRKTSLPRNILAQSDPHVNKAYLPPDSSGIVYHFYRSFEPGDEGVFARGTHSRERIKKGTNSDRIYRACAPLAQEFVQRSGWNPKKARFEESADHALGTTGKQPESIL
jgi:hypothetical protein